MEGDLRAVAPFASGPSLGKIIEVERNRLNLDGVDQYDQHFL
jgi:hypothetical protein